MTEKMRKALKALDDALAERKDGMARLEARFPGEEIDKNDKAVRDEEKHRISETADRKCLAAYDELVLIKAEIYNVQPRPADIRPIEPEDDGNTVPSALSWGRLRVAHEVFNEGRIFLPRLIPFPFEKGVWFPSKKGSLRQLWGLLLRLLSVMPPGKLEIYAGDPLQMGKSLEPFLPLLQTKSLFPPGCVLTDGRDIEGMLGQLDAYVSGLIQKTFASEPCKNWKSYNENNPDKTLPYKILIMMSVPEQVSDTAMTYLKRILSHSRECGILPLLLVNEEKLLDEKSPAKYKNLFADIKDWTVRMDALLPPFGLRELKLTEEEAKLPGEAEMKSFVESVKERARTAAETPHDIAALFDEAYFWKGNSTENVTVPVGWTGEGSLVNFSIGDVPAHGLLAGATRTGKSNLLHVIIQSLCFSYPPDELHIYLMDFKDGVEFNLYCEPPLPHAMLIATVNDAELGTQALTHLVEEMEKRNETFKAAQVRNFIEYRAKKSMPRVLVLIDEFQEIFKDKRSEDIFNQLLRKGGSAGIHLLCSTQTLHGLNAVSLSQLTANLGCRIALNCREEESRQILGQNNTAAARIEPRKEAVLNNANGEPSANIIFTHPKAEPALIERNLKRFADEALRQGFITMTKFIRDEENPPLPDRINVSAPHGICLELGMIVSYESGPLRITLPKSAGANLLIAGAGDRLHDGLLGAVLKSAASQCDEIILCCGKVAEYVSEYAGMKKIRVITDPATLDFEELRRTNSKRLLIIDALEEERALRPSAGGLNQFSPRPGAAQTATAKKPGEEFARFLEEGPAAGVPVVVLCRNWIAFNTHYKALLQSFPFCVVYNMEGSKAAECINGGKFGDKPVVGLDNENRALFSNSLENCRILFKPYIRPK
jgi:hypothetical protein